jgi:hypothetical protein
VVLAVTLGVLLELVELVELGVLADVEITGVGLEP